MRLVGPVLLVALAIPGPAPAQSRPDARALTCDATRRLVDGAGAIVVTTGPYTFERFVASAQFCERRDTLIPMWIATRDQAQCPVGFRCGPIVSSPSR
jgi:hypothetical protein